MYKVNFYTWFQIMAESIGDRDAAIAERLRELLAAANNTAAAFSAAAVPSAGAQPSTTPASASRRIDPSADPAQVVANLTAAGIQFAVSYMVFIILVAEFYPKSVCKNLRKASVFLNQSLNQILWEML